MSQRNSISRLLNLSSALQCICVTVLMVSNVFAQTTNSPSALVQVGGSAKLGDAKTPDSKQADKAPSEKTLRDFGKMDLEILYLEKVKKLEELKSPKVGGAAVASPSSAIESKALVSLAPSQTMIVPPSRPAVVKKSKSSKPASGKEVSTAVPIPRPSFKLKSMFGMGGNLTAVLSTGENSVASLKKGQMINGWTLEKFLENGVVVSNGEHQSILLMSHDKVPAGNASSSATVDTSGGNQLSARQLPNPRIER